MNVIVFDIGGTLMEYVNMPNVWSTGTTRIPACPG